MITVFHSTINEVKKSKEPSNIKIKAISNIKKKAELKNKNFEAEKYFANAMYII
jgi:hypothetical protein